MELSDSLPADNCLCLGIEFGRYLREKSRLSLRVTAGDIPPPEGGSKGFDLIVGWEATVGEDSASRLEMIYRALNEEGEARLFGFYLQPSRNDIHLWEDKCRKRGERGELPLPLPGSVSMGAIAALLKSTPFERYTVRKKGIYYEAVLQK